MNRSFARSVNSWPEAPGAAVTISARPDAAKGKIIQPRRFVRYNRVRSCATWDKGATMRLPLGGLLATLLALTAGTLRADDDEVKAKIAAQKKTAETVWTTIEAGEAAPVHETSRVLLVAPKSEEKRLTALGNLMDKAFDKACAALKIDPVKDPPWTGKLTVYYLTERDHFTS